MAENLKPKETTNQSPEDRQHALDRKRFVVECLTLFFLFVYVVVNMFLWCETRKTYTLQLKTNRAIYRPWVKDAWMTIQQKGDDMWVSYAVKNSGQTTAYEVKIAMKFEYRTTQPSTSERKFGDGEFTDMTPKMIQPFSNRSPSEKADQFYSVGPRVFWNHPKGQVPENTAYVWGTIQYVDYLGWPETIDFCDFAAARDVLTKSFTDAGFNTGFNSCE